VSHPYYHALSAAKHFGGGWRDYAEIERWFDQTKGHIVDARHRLLLHNDFGGTCAKRSSAERWSVPLTGEKSP